MNYIYSMTKARTSSQIDFLSPLCKIPGLGPKRQNALEAAEIKTIGDLLYYYPVRYIDRTKCIPIADVKNFTDNASNIVTIRGTVEKIRTEYFGRVRYRITLRDDSGETGETIDAVWYIRSMKIAPGETLILTGKIHNLSKGKFAMYHPTLEKITVDSEVKPILAVYSIKEPMRQARVNQSLLRKSIEWALKNVGNYPRVLPAAIESKYKFPLLGECLYYIHLPDDLSALDKYRERLKYEELYKLALNLRWNKRKFALPGHAMSSGELDASMRALLPFALTESQERAITILYADAAKPHRMHRLLQGDVGSGKTITALMAALPSLNSGRQVAWMAPTEVLAKQTKIIAEKYVGGLGVKVDYLGAGDSHEKREILVELASGKLRFVVGTHALFMPSVTFGNLGMVIIDEQHKFGAAQRLKLQEKGAASDFLMMSATPIPQTLAKTLYGDLDIVEITSRPGRVLISTHIVPPKKRGDMENFIFEQITNNKVRIFYVVPRIDQQGDDDSDSTDANDDDKKTRRGAPVVSTSKKSTSMRNITDCGTDNAPSIKTVDTIVEKLRSGPLASVPIHKLHGQMSYEERDEAIRAFRDGPPGVLVATTIIEVGVDVADAAVMVIENPEFFGLAQLHQIRGRVGRSDIPSYCFLLPGNNISKDETSLERLKFLCSTLDGFEIAEWDLRNRGPGDAAGYRQSGWDDLCMADILEDAGMFRGILEDMEMLLI